MNYNNRERERQRFMMMLICYLNDPYLMLMYYQQMYFVHMNGNILYLILIHEKDFVLILYQEEFVQCAKKRVYMNNL